MVKVIRRYRIAGFQVNTKFIIHGMKLSKTAQKWAQYPRRHCYVKFVDFTVIIKYTLCPKKTSPTFLAVTWKSIIRF